MTKRTQIFLSLFLTVTSLFHAQQIDQSALKSLIDQQIGDDTPGVAVGVVYKGDVVFEHYAGFANLEYQIPVDDKSVFNIASVAKQFTAAMVVDLSLQGKINLQDDLRTYLPDLYTAIKEPITLEQILTHTSGIRDYCDLMAVQRNPWWRREGLSNKTVLKILQKQQTLNFEPGTDYTYSNSGYIVLAAVIAKVTGESFADYSKSWFKSIGLNHTQFSDNYMEVIPNKTTAYANWGDGRWQIYPMITDLHGDGFLYTTLADMLNYEKQIQAAVLADQDSWQAKTQQALNLSPTGYSYGLEQGSFSGQPMIYHSGATGAYGAHVARLPQDEIAVFVMNNGIVDASYLATQVLETIYGAQEQGVASPSMPETLGPKPKESSILGTYLLESSTEVAIVKRNDTLFREIKGANPVALEHFKGNVYKYTNGSGLALAFVPSEKSPGKMDFEMYHPQIPTRKAGWLPPLEIIPEELQKLSGDFSNTELDSDMLVRYLGENQFTVQLKDRPLDAELIRANTIRVNGGYILTPQFNADNSLKGFSLNYGRVQNVIYTPSAKN
ncbi:serine hydrolase domain-containing protein [Gilvibacter sediminis]|uniref:serine hydrolase domain-containing protein n=1 Tax=Gilvibacter sediminis TaxID=379071 RepID=UPI00234FEBE6|nr:serine hydrolase domain-containing protein [Gilvibacter sediminis]MDC7999008.1 serine hydrolase [Gilvibacter sediminis]